MKSAVIIFPGSNRDKDMTYAIKKISSVPPIEVWHRETTLPEVDLIVLPGGFSYGDYLRTGAIAARSPIIPAVVKAAKSGKHILGVCNGFQILTEVGLVPGTLMRNANLKFVCKKVNLQTENNQSAFSSAFSSKQVWECPVSHHDGNFFTTPETLKKMEDFNQIIFRYTSETNPNGSINDIAGVTNEDGNVLGLMPHPENQIESFHGGSEGRLLFESLINHLN